MYINFNLAQNHGLILHDIILLQMIYQNKFEDHSKNLEHFEPSFEKFENQGLVTYIKGKKNDSKSSLIRLTVKGNKILEEIQIPEINLDDLDVYSWLENVYKQNDKEVGNAKKTKLLIAQFRVNSGIERNHLVFLCKTFIFDEKEMEYSKRLEYLFWKPSNLFQTKFDIDQSRLYQYYLKKKEYFDGKFAQIKN